MIRTLSFALLLSFFFSISPPASTSTLASEAVVKAVLFYSPSCGHCHYVITEVFPALFEQYGAQLNIIGVDISETSGRELFLAALQYFKSGTTGVPFLVVGDVYLVGSIDIPEKFPGLIEQYLAQGGVDWPPIPGFVEALATAQPTLPPTSTPPLLETAPTATPLASAASSPLLTPTSTPGLLLAGTVSSGWRANFANDPQGNSLAVIVLAGMVLSVAGAVLYFRRSSGAPLPKSWAWAVPILCLLGLGLAGYLAYVETTHITAVCGVVGDCNAVHQSQYARLFGVLPIGILGVVGYVLMLVAWAVGRAANPRLAAYANLFSLGMAAFGVLFSIYLTFLEPFVIGATCAWCLASAVIMTALLVLSLAPGKQAALSLQRGKKRPHRKPVSRSI